MALEFVGVAVVGELSDATVMVHVDVVASFEDFSASNCCACIRCKMTTTKTMSRKVPEVDICSCNHIWMDLPVHYNSVVDSSDDVSPVVEQLNNTWF